ncbi:MAG TPA: glycosyltransferase [Phycisphaerales bacterium]|nr:glycosyltransferase [Phycisphaerales bacterium]
MRILHYVASTDSRLGGVPRFVLDACRVMADQGHETVLATCDTTDTPPAWTEAGARSGGMPEVVRVGHGRLPHSLSSASMKVLRRELERCDVLHLHSVWSIGNMQLAAAARELGVPYIVTTHGMLDEWSVRQGAMKKKLYMALGGRRMMDGAAAIHCTAQAEFDQSKRFFPRTPCAIVPYVQDLAPYRELPGRALARDRFEFLRSSGEPVVLFLSRLHYKKGVEFLIEAAGELAKRGVKAQFAIAGTGDDQYLKFLQERAERVGVTDRVHFVGQVKGAEKLSLYQNADAFVLPTSQENFGLVLIEAMACGTPVVTTKGTDIWQDVLASGGASIVSQSAVEIADAVQRIVTNPEQQRAMGSAARPWVFRTYDEGVLAPRFARLYSQVAAMGRESKGAPVAEGVPALLAV